MQEQAFLQAAVSRIVSFSPDVLVVEKSVARYAGRARSATPAISGCRAAVVVRQVLLSGGEDCSYERVFGGALVCWKLKAAAAAG